MNSICNFDTPEGTDSTVHKESSDCINLCFMYTPCSLDQLGDGKCDPGDIHSACNFSLCGWDWGDCGYCVQGCFKEDLDNPDICKEECNNSDCILQGGICVRFI
jgi:hypothetical protein